MTATRGLPPFDEIEAGFGRIDDWEDRFALLVALGRLTEQLPEAERVEAHRLPGCSAGTWMAIDWPTDPAGAVRLRSWSDSPFVLGLLAVVTSIHQGMTRDMLQSSEPEATMAGIGLSDYLGMHRANGLRSAFRTIRAKASLPVVETAPTDGVRTRSALT